LLRDGYDLLDVLAWRLRTLDLVCSTDTLSTYPAFAYNWNIGFALTASHFAKAAK